MSKQTQMFQDDEVAAAADVLRAGGVLAFATETVYGLGADARNGEAVAAVYAAKGRPAFNPLIIHVANFDVAQRYGVFSDAARLLAEAFWPGPLSLVVPLRPDAGLSSLVTAGLDTVAIRVPAHAGAQALLSAFEGPVAAPSANPSGGISPTRSDHVLAGLDGRIDGILEGGDCAVGLESTILMAGDDDVALLRAGGVAVEDVEAVLRGPIARPSDPETPQSPGQLASHYAPNAAVRINAVDKAENEILIGFGAVQDADFTLSEMGSVNEAAANLFAVLHAADKVSDGRRIAISPVPMMGLGLAINDRLERAAADRK